MRKPRLFIASSVESKNVAEAVNANLDHELEVTIWTAGTFKLSSSAIDNLVEKSSSVDFALFIFAPDDIATIRSRQQHIVRDNVVFEMGLFVGAIGKNRCFILKPRDTDMHLPTDLLGVHPADYDASRSDGDLVSATNKACLDIKAAVKDISIINHASLSATKRLQANPAEYSLSEIDFKFLASCLQSYTNKPNGLTFYDISSNISNHKGGFGSPYNSPIEESQIRIAAIKLGRMGLIDKTIADDEEGYEYYSYLITELGIDILLKNEDKLYSKPQDTTPSFNIS